MAEILRFVTETARDGNQYMSAITAEGTIRFNSNYRPVAEAETWAAGQQLVTKGAVVLLFGIGNGYCLKAMLERLPQDGVLIAYEPSEQLFTYVKEQYKIAELLSDSRVILVVGKELHQRIYALLDQYIHWSNAKKQCFCVHPQYDKLFSEQLACFEEIVRANNVRVFTNRNTEMHFGQTIAENVVENLPYVPGAGMMSGLIGKFPAGAAAIIVAAGPSLDKNIDELKRAKGRAFIIAVDTSLKALHAHNIIPDAVVTIDAELREKHVVDTDFAQIPLFAKNQANHKILSLHHAQKIWFDCHGYLKRFYERIGRKSAGYHTGASVATAAFSLCAALGLKRIILIGQDLAYLGDVTHAGGQVLKIQAEDENVCYVDGVDGGKVKTRHDWIQYLRWFERVVHEVDGEIEVIDATEGGARIRGTKLYTLAESIDQYCTVPVDFSAILEENICGLNMQEKRQFGEYLQKGMREADKIRKISAAVCTFCDREMAALGKVKQEEMERYCEEHERMLQEFLTSQNAVIVTYDIYLLIDDSIKQISIPAITDMLEAEGTKEQCFRIKLTANRKIYYAMADAAQKLGTRLHFINIVS